MPKGDIYKVMPKLRQLTRAKGCAPTQARFINPSATINFVPTRGLTAHQRWFPSVVIARPLLVSRPLTGSRNFKTVASYPGPTTVFKKS